MISNQDVWGFKLTKKKNHFRKFRRVQTFPLDSTPLYNFDDEMLLRVNGRFVGLTSIYITGSV